MVVDELPELLASAVIEDVESGSWARCHERQDAGQLLLAREETALCAFYLYTHSLIIYCTKYGETDVA